MHELSVCLSLLQQLEKIAGDRKAVAVEKVFLEVGPLSGIEPALLKSAYPLAAAGTLAANAELIISTSDIVVSCTQCSAESPAKANRLLCSACGDFRTQVVSGDEMILQRMEMTLAH
jgi:hydrogenase nickel incorporation protein HypA/HybF